MGGCFMDLLDRFRTHPLQSHPGQFFVSPLNFGHEFPQILLSFMFVEVQKDIVENHPDHLKHHHAPDQPLDIS